MRSNLSVPSQFGNHLGLTSDEVERQRRVWGPNEIVSAFQPSLLKFGTEALCEPLTLILLICSGVYVVIGDRTEGLLLLVSGLTVALMTFIQRFRTEKALEALTELTVPKTEVIRNGSRQIIESREVVPKDLVVLQEGMRITADGFLIESHSLEVDESLLTGESEPVPKSVEPGQAQVWAGTLLTRGGGVAKVCATGTHTELGKIGSSLSVPIEKTTRLQRELRELLRLFMGVGLVFCFLVFFSYFFSKRDLLEALLAGLSTAMAMLPEELLLILNLFLALGALRLSRLKAFVRTFSALENLGSITVLCVDKTGTLTENKMTVRTLKTHQETWDWNPSQPELPESFHLLVEYAWLASHQEPFDPMEKAIREVVVKSLRKTEHVHPEWTLLREYPLTRQLLAVSAVWQNHAERERVIATKGAPEAIIDLCHLSKSETDHTLRQVSELAQRGLRVIGVAKGAWNDSSPFPKSIHDVTFRFVGLLGLQDPLRSEVPQALKECSRAGIRVIMITGDYPETAHHIALEAGFPKSLQIIPGSKLIQTTDEQLAALLDTDVSFARISHQQKLRVVKALQLKGEIVAMTGDGVNDASSLKEADIGIALGQTATDVAREASDLFLMEPDFRILVQAIALGRKIFDNIRTSLKYILSVHVPVGALTLLPVVLGWPFLLHPIHLVFLQLIIYPICSFAIEAIQDHRILMNQPPRRISQPLFDRRLILSSLERGGIAALIILMGYGLLISLKVPIEESRTIIFTALLGSQWGLLVTSLPTREMLPFRFKGNNFVFSVFFLSLSLLLMSLFQPDVRELFHFAPLSFVRLVGSFLAGYLSGATWRPKTVEVS